MDSEEKPFSIYEITQLQAAFDILNKTDIAFYRKVSRWYSNQFHTPLHIVMSGSIPWDEILLHYYEFHYDKLPYNDLLKLAHDFLPELAQAKEEEEDEFLKRLMEADKAKKQSLKKPSTKQPIFPQIPQSQTSEVMTKVFDVDESEEQ